MKPSFLFLWATIATSGVAAPDPVAPAERPRLTEQLRMKVENISPPPSAIIGVAQNGSLMLEPYKVKSTYVPPLLKREEEPEPESRPFTWAEGGYFWQKRGKVFTRDVKVQYSPRNRGFELLRFSW